MAAGKTAEFATDILEYLFSGTASLPTITHNTLYIGLLSEFPAGDAPYTAAQLSAVEVLNNSQIWRAPLPVASIGAVTAIANDAMSRTTTAEVAWPTAAVTGFTAKGYVIAINDTTQGAGVYLAYETFPEGSGKQRVVGATDNVKINSGGLVIKEK